MIITTDYTCEKDAILDTPIIIAADGITVDGNGATITGPGVPGERETFQGNGIFADGCSHVTLRNFRVHGFETGILIKNGSTWIIEECDASDNYTNLEFGWGEYKSVGGIVLNNVSHTIIRRNRANNVWDGLNLWDCSHLIIEDNDFSHCSNVCLKLWASSYNRAVRNNLSYGLRIEPGEVHARDASGILVEHASNYNYFYHNDVTHGGDGVFVRALEGVVSRGNVFLENDTSYAHNNGFEAWCPENAYIKNKSNYCSYGFWLGGSDKTILIGNEAAFNGKNEGHSNAPEKDFGHGGIVAVGGSSSHTIARDNYCHDNAGGGIVFRGDLRTNGADWQSFHWIIQNNRLERNLYPFFIRYATMITLCGNTCTDNDKPSYIEDVTDVVTLDETRPTAPSPRAVLHGPSCVIVGTEAQFDASESTDPSGKAVRFRWHIDAKKYDTPVVRHTFDKPGFYHVALTVDNGSSADLASIDLLVLESQPLPLHQWKWSLKDDQGATHPVDCQIDAPGVSRPCGYHIAPRVTGGGTLEGECILSEPPLADANALVFWIQSRFSIISEYRKNNPIITCVMGDTCVSYTPLTPEGEERSLFMYPLISEGRWGWQRVVIPLEGNAVWKKHDAHTVTPEKITAVRMSVIEPKCATFDLWIDALHFAREDV